MTKNEAKGKFLPALAAAAGMAPNPEAEKHFAATTPTSTGEVALLDVRCLKPSPYNPRAAVGNVDELAASIKAQGLLVPLLVRELGEDVFEVVSGHRRLKAAQQAGLGSVPCDVRDFTDVQALEVNLTEQINKKDLTPLEEGEACRRLIELSGYTPEQTGKKLGQSTSWVTKRLALCGVAPEVAKALQKGEVSLTVATALAALPTPELQVEAMEKLEDSKYDSFGSRVETAEEQVAFLRNEVCRSLKGAPFDTKSETLVPEAGPCTTCPHNSASNRMPGLFDNSKAGPTCAKPDCFEEKAEAAWQAKTAKMKEAGAKILPASVGQKLFRYGTQLQYGNKYVDGQAVEHKDKSKRTWNQLVKALPEDARPQMHVVRDRDGNVRELYLEAKAHEAVAKHLKLKWAKKEAAGDSPAAQQKAKESEAAREAREAVFEDISTTGFRHFAQKGLSLVAARELARVAEYDMDRLSKATGQKYTREWLTKKATLNELLAVAWWWNFRESSGYGSTLAEPGVKETAKALGLDLDRLLKAQLEVRAKETAAAAEKKPAKKKKAAR